MDYKDTSVGDWFEEIADSRKRHSDFLKDGVEINEIYECKETDKVPFNILYSNTETLMPALYSQTPRPIVKRRFNQEASILVKACEKAGTRILEYFIDTNMEGYEKFDDSMLDAVKDGALPGRGITQIKYDAVMEGDELKYPTINTESKKWNKVNIGYAEKWSKVPWISFEEYLEEDECRELFDSEKVNAITFTESESTGDKDSKSKDDNRKTAEIQQIWDKKNKKVRYITPSYDGYLDEIVDPLGITGFFPIPKPLCFINKSNSMSVTTLYSTYQNQAKELNRITERLNQVIEAIKVRGVVDGSLSEDLQRVLDEDDNIFVATDKGAALIEGGFDKAIWMMPIEKLVNVMQSLFQAREECKRVIYEITGLSDIIRGNSRASETLGAQKIKETWGAMRLKNMQRGVQKYVRDSLRIMLDVASTKIPPRFWSEFTGLPYPLQEAKDAAIAEIQAIQQQFEKQTQEAQLLAQQGQQVQPPQQPQIDPELESRSKLPSWEEILVVLSDDLTRSYSIDIETNSTLDVEATEDQEQVAEFMNAMAQFMNGIMPMVQAQVMPFGAAKSMLLEIARRFRFGVDVENEIKSMEEPKGGDPEEAKKKLEEQAKQMQEQMKKAQAEIEKGKAELEKTKQTFEAEMKKAGEELDTQFNELEQAKMQFEFDKKLFMKEQQLNQQFMVKEIQMEKKEAESEVKNMLGDSKRNLQSMLDKHSAAIEKTVNKSTETKDED